MKKRLWSLLVVCLLLTGLLPVNVLAAEDTGNLLMPAGIQTYDVGDKMFEEIEPNDRMSLADYVFSGYTVSGTLTGEDVDYFKLELESKSELRCVAATIRNSFVLNIFDQKGKTAGSVVQSDYADGIYTYGSVITLNAGIYYFEAKDSGQAAFNQYLFFIETTHVHNWDDGKIDIETESALYTCKDCGETKTEKVQIDRDALVSRISGADRYQTAFKTADRFKAEAGLEKFEAVVVATGKNFADALSGSYLAYVKEAPILLTNGKNVEDVKEYIRANLKNGGTVYLLGGTAAVPETMENGLDGYKVERLYGQSRYDTNRMILEEVGLGSGEVVVCTGKNYADSLSASAVKMPILLVKGELTEEQERYLRDKEISQFYIIGGAGAVSDAVEEELGAYAPAERIYGSTRYETSAAVAARFFENAESAVLAYGKNFPDGLCAGPLACTMEAPLLLTADGKTTAAYQYTTSAGIEKGYVLGGDILISDEAVREIFHKSSDTVIIVY